MSGSSSDANSALLARFRPVIQYDSQESFYADSCAGITDLVVGSGHPPGGHCNFLKRADNSVLAAARPTDGQTQLNLALLAGQNYSDGASVQRGDFLDELGRDYVGDARLLHANPNYADKIFGHAVRDRTGTLWLDYWFWHYYNDKAFLGFGLHEGDWEGVQIRLDSNGQPDQVAYAQHSGGQRATWDQLEHQATTDGPAPVVYSARGSHASYMRRGRYDSAPFVPDHNDGRGPRRRPQVIVISDSAPGWVAWPGRWGSTRASLPVEADSPKGPSQHMRWHDPLAFHAQATPPPAAAPGSAVGADLAAPPAPTVTARRKGDKAVIEYAFPNRPLDAPPPKHLVISLDARDKQAPPATYRFDVEGDHGTIVQPLPPEPGDFSAHASAASDDGVASNTVSEPLTGEDR